MGAGRAASSAPGGGEGTLVGVLADPVLWGWWSCWAQRVGFRGGAACQCLKTVALIVMKGMWAVH